MVRICNAADRPKRRLRGLEKILNRLRGVRELLIHENDIVIYRVRGGELQILRFRHARRKPLTVVGTAS